MSASKPDTIETIRQWGIKAISSRVVEAITREIAQLEATTGAKITNGQMIEKLWDNWERGGASIAPQPVNRVDELVKLVGAGGPWGEKNPLPAEVRKLMNSHARLARGAAPVPTSQPPVALAPPEDPATEAA